MNEQAKQWLIGYATQRGGMITAHEVVDAARDEECPLHSYFEWDDSEAARLYRVEQARGLIQKVTVRMEKKPEVQHRAFVSVPSDRKSGGGYRFVKDAVADDEFAAEIRQEIARNVRKWQAEAALLDAALRTWVNSAPVD